MKRFRRTGRVCLALSALAWAVGTPAVAWAHGSHGSSGGSHGSSGGSSGGWNSHGSHGSSGGSSGGWSSPGSSGGSSGSYYYRPASPPAYPPPAPDTNPAPPGASATRAAASGVARVVVTLPSDAKLFAQNKPTQSGGEQRRFVSPPIRAGAEYTYELRVELTRDGRTITKSQQVRVRAGQNTTVEFRLPSVDATELVASVR